MTREDFLNQIADFSWMWGKNFHLQVGDRAYLWSSPEYGGDNTIRPYPHTQDELGKMHADSPVPWSRDKGAHRIKDYCGENVVLGTDLYITED